MEIYDLKTGERLSGKAAEIIGNLPLCAALGNFDGVHIGHAELIRTAAAQKESCPGSACAVWTFSTHPHGEDAKSITTTEEKLERFAALSADYAVFASFDKLRGYSPERFVNEILCQRLNAFCAVCGFNYRFGSKGAGTPELLLALMEQAGRRAVIVPKVTLGGESVSSTRIRRLIEAGDMAAAAENLGRPFSVKLPVEHGKRLGRTIGIPTVNQRFEKGHVIPARGVYCCRCYVNGTAYSAVTNVGSRPTVNSDTADITCETHIIGFDGDLYGQNIRIDFYKKLRDEMKFESVEELKAAAQKDVAAAISYFGE